MTEVFNCVTVQSKTMAIQPNFRGRQVKYWTSVHREWAKCTTMKQTI